MNFGIYRLVFSASRGMVVPADEHASARCTGPRSRARTTRTFSRRGPDTSFWFAARASAFAALCAFGMQPLIVDAQATLPMTADRASGNHPVVGVSASGVPLVNIVAPNGAGVSLNHFTHYNVGTKGAVIVNTPRSAQTQIAGWVQGNPLMGNSPARLIINQVTSGNPTRLLGMTEIAGNRANLVIANPAGITCAGCGFINVPRVSLATARPAFNADGSLSGFDVTRGHLGVSDAGLDARGSAIDLIARAMQINGKIWAQSIQATAGANHVSYLDGTAVSQAGEGERPSFAIDVQALGGMYAGSVRLIGTEAGVGVRQSGDVSSLTGSIELSANGDVKIEPASRIQSAGELSVAAANLTNEGAIVGGRGVRLKAQAALRNDGLVGAFSSANLTGRDVINRGDIFAGADAMGALAGPGSVTLTGLNVSSSGRLGSGDNVNVTGATVSLDGGTVYAASALNVNGDRSLTTRGTEAIAFNATLGSNGTFVNDRGVLDVLSDMKVGVRSVSNLGGRLSGRIVTMKAADVDNTGGELFALSRAHISTKSLTNDEGAIVAVGHLSIESPGDVSNRQGLIAAGKKLDFSARSLRNNALGEIGSFAGDAAVAFTGDADNARGRIVSAGRLSLRSEAFDNTSGHVRAGTAQNSTTAQSNETGGQESTGRRQFDVESNDGASNPPGERLGADGLKLDVASIKSNKDGQIDSRAGAARITARDSLNNADGTMSAAGKLTVRAGEFDNTSGNALADVADVNVDHQLTNTDGRIIAARPADIEVGKLVNQKGVIAAVGDALTVTTTSAIDNAHGKLLAGGDVILASSGLTNIGGTVSGANVRLKAGTGQIDNTRGAIDAVTGLQTESGTFDNRSGLIQSRGSARLDTDGGTFDNRAAEGSEVGGRLIGKGVTLTTGDLQNRAGVISSSGKTRVEARWFTNDQGAIVSHGALTVESVGGISNVAGQIGGDADVSLKGTTIDNTRGAVHAGQSLAVNGEAIINAETKERVVAPLSGLSPLPAGMEGATVLLTATAQIDNTAGSIRSDQETTLRAETVANTDGTLTSPGRVLVDARATVTNTRGDINGGQLLEVSTGAMNNDGKMQSLGDILIEARDDLTNSGTMVAGHNMDVRAQGNVKNDGTMNARNVANVFGQRIDNGSSGEIGGDQGTLVHAKQSLTNEGLIDGGATRVEAAGMLANLGRIYGDSISLGAPLLRNDADAKGVGAAIASRGDLDIGAKVIVNDGGSLLYASKDIRVGRELAANGRASEAWSDRFTNNGSLLDAGGHLDILAKRFENLNANFQTQKETTDSGRKVWYTVPDKKERLDPSDVYFYHRNSLEARTGEQYQWALDDDQKRLLLPSTQYPFAEYAKYTVNGVAGRIDPVHFPAVPNQFEYRGDAKIGADTVGVFRKVSDDMWAKFGIAPPPAAPNPSYVRPGNYVLAGSIFRGRRELGRDWYSVNVPLMVSRSDNGITGKQESCLGSAADYCAPFNQWFDKFTKAYVSLGRAVNDYNSDVWNRAVERWTIYDVNVKSTKDVVTATQPGRIVAAGGITIRAESGINDKSQIVAGGKAYLNDAIQDNRQPKGVETFDASGRAISTWVEEAGGFSGDERKHDWKVYAAPLPSREIDLPISAVPPVNQDPVKRVAADASAARGVSGVHVTGAQMQPTEAGGVLRVDATSADAQPIKDNARAGAIARAKLGAIEIRTVEPNVNLPNNALYQAVPDRGSRYLVETDPRFTNHKHWLSSDRMVAALSTDPGAVQKRLGDGFYEQQLVQQQIIEATGQRFIGNYTDNQTQYQALMANGAKAAKRFDMNVGTALTDAQMAALTDDIVWLVSRDVTLADGTQQSVLVPQVYLRAKAADVTGTGSLIAGESVAVQNKGALANSGTIASRSLTIITADSITNVGTVAGGKVRAEANEDLKNLGGLIQGDGIALSAGRDVTLSSTISSAETANGSTTAIDRVSTLNAGTLAIHAGRDLNTDAAQIVSTGHASLKAQRDVNIRAIRESSDDHVQWDEKNKSARSASIDTGTAIASDGNVAIVAGRDLNATAASVSAQGALGAVAGRDVNLNAGEHSASAYDEHAMKERALLSSKSTHAIDASSYTGAIGTTLSGNTVEVLAGNNVTAKAATIAGTGNVNVEAGNDLRVTTADTSSSEYHFKDVKKSGFGSAGAGISYGTNRTTDTSRDTIKGSLGSLIGSLGGNVSLRAGNKLHVTGSDLVAAGDVTGIAKEVKVDASQTDRHHEETHEVRSSGVSLALKAPAIDAIQNPNRQAHGAANSQDGRAAALRGIAAAGAAADLVDAAGGVTNALSEKTQLEAKVEFSFGSSHSKAKFTEDSTQHNGSRVKAGGKVAFVATGEKETGQGNVTIEGSDVTAKGVLLRAKDRVNLVNSTDTDRTRSTNESKSASVGVSVGTGGFGVSAAMSRAHGDANSDAKTQNNTHITASNQVTIMSGGDTNIVGANVDAYRVTGKIGGNLNIASVQDTSESVVRQRSIGGGFSASAGGGSGSVSAQMGNARGKYAGVNEQSGIRAGDGGFDLEVKGNTDLKGAYIASTAEGEKNRLVTGTLSFSDVENSSSYRASSAGISAGGGFGNGGNNYATHGPRSGKNSGGALPAAVSESGRSDALTRSAISDGSITIVDEANQKQDLALLHRDATNLNGAVDKLADLQNALSSQSDLIDAAQAAAETVAKQIGKYAEKKQDEALKAAEAETDPQLKAQFEQEAKSWAEGGNNRVKLHIAGGAVTGGLTAGALGAAGGAAGAGLSATLAPKFDEFAQSIREAGPTGNGDVDDLLGNVMSNLLAGGAGALVGGPTGAMTSAATDRHNRQLHQREYDDAKRHAKTVAKELGISEQEAEGRIVAEILRNSDEQTAQASGGKHGYEIRSIVGCQNLNCDGYKNDPQYANHAYNSEYIEPNRASYDFGQRRLGHGQTYNELATSNIKQDPVGSTLAGVGMMALGVVTGGPLAPVSMMGIGTALGLGVNGSVQLTSDKPFDWASFGAAGVTGALTTGMRFTPVLFTNVGGALTSSALNGENPNGAMGGAAVGTAIGYPIGSKVEGKFHDVLNPWYRQEWVDVGMGVSKYVPPSTIPSWVGGLGSGVIQEGPGAAVQNKVDGAVKK